MNNITQVNKVLSDSEELNMAMRVEPTQEKIAGSTLILSVRDCQNYIVTLVQNITEVEFINPLLRYNEYYTFSFTVTFVQGGTGNKQINFKNPVYFPGNSTSQLSTTAGHSDTFTFFSIDAGKSYLIRSGARDTIFY